MISLWLIAATLAGQGPSAGGPTTLQGQFEQASASLAAEKWSEALAEFQAIDTRASLGTRTRSVVKMRKGLALARLGRGEEAIAAVRAGVAAAPPGDTSLNDDLCQSRLLLGEALIDLLDYAAARQEFERALTLANDAPSQLAVELAIARVAMFDDRDAALASADAAVKLLASQPHDKVLDGKVHSWRGRVLLNRGDVKGALAELNIALKDFGGLTARTDLNDVQIRSNLALASLLANNRDQAREYLAMTGEGRLPNDAVLSAPADAELPPCGKDFGPDDTAVVEFGLSPDGTVIYAQPVYASKPGPMALDFARAVYSFSWQSDRVAKLPLFFRYGVRLELRCSIAPDRPDILSLLRSDVSAWLEAQHVTVIAAAGRTARDVRARRGELMNEEAAGDTPATVAKLLLLADSGVSGEEQRRSLYDRAHRISVADHAPTPVQTYFAIAELQPPTRRRKDMSQYVTQLKGLLADPAVAADVRSAITLRLILAQLTRIHDPAAAGSQLDKVVADDRLDRHDPLRVAALLQLAAIKAEKHDLPGAQQLYQLTGLDDQQCALVDPQPLRVHGGANQDDYPDEARSWGMSGWARTEFDIKPDGSTTNVRTVMAYPPFVFGKPIEHVATKLRFTQSYQPGGGLGCGGQVYQQGFRYVTR